MSDPAVLDRAPVEQALASFREGGRWWARPLVAALESQRPGQSLSWAVACLRSLLGDISSDRLAALDPDLVRLTRLAEGGAADPAELLRESEAVWYRPPGRDLWQTAVARLYAALAYRLRGEGDAFQREVASALAVAADDERFTPDHLNRVTQLFSDSWQHPGS